MHSNAHSSNRDVNDYTNSNRISYANSRKINQNARHKDNEFKTFHIKKSISQQENIPKISKRNNCFSIDIFIYIKLKLNEEKKELIQHVLLQKVI